jgi:prepilin-type N-terminal cleavage/methylation domain-containing protein
MQRNNKKAFSLIELSIVILIIGILVAGVTQGSRLIAQFKLSNARNQTSGSPVSSIQGLSFWLETTSIESFGTEEPDNEDVVATWNDINPQTSFNNNATSAGSPEYISNCLNDLPCVRFDGVDDEFTLANAAMLRPATIFVVMRPDTAAATSTILGSATGGLSLSLVAGVPTLNQNGAAIGGDGDTLNLTSPQVVTATYSVNTDGSFTFFVDGEAGSFGDNALAIISGAVSIGHDPIGTDEFFEGDVAEVIVFERVLKTEERESIEAYLGKKWEITIN